MRLLATTVLTVLTVLTALLACCPAFASPPPEVPVGRMHRAWVDEDRRDWSGAGPRPLAATVWYPAAPGSPVSPWTGGVFEFGSFATDAPFADTTRRPLVLLSHGTGGSAAQLSWLAQELVRAGFVVAAVNHHGNTAAEPRTTLAGFVLPGERVLDLSALIDRLLADPAIGPRIDPERIGAAGFSIGGYSVLAAAGARIDFATRARRCAGQPANPVCVLPPEAGFDAADIARLAESDPAFRASVERELAHPADPRIRAVYAMAPAHVSLMQDAEVARLLVPARVVLAETDDQILFAETAAVLADRPGIAVERIDAAGHYVFLATCTARGREVLAALCVDPQGVERGVVHRRVAEDAVAFFARHL
ncbi:alpha/beta hydrolase family protein [Arenimonas composti]|uniref:Peptidase S9 prolyl oligopeptidase catalytic domain-containing protein n=1 Tax=Arenimonas composti TR7-09 = DSM 18010 TaxID=1121013 RepID=A0A091BJD8_9GAMM|nr:prolyl oligopeptidase family serine peptidase [Arenimonas composti]KFN50894.1 hypothetical protein P873_00670 [Arenimonas composti TR7-09 = DSM 18010]